jgi:hypothetical protein
MTTAWSLPLALLLLLAVLLPLPLLRLLLHVATWLERDGS